MKQPTLIPKSVSTRVLELIDALQLVKDALDNLKLGKQRYINVLSGQLRALIYEKSKKHVPLLPSVAEQFGKQLTFHFLPIPEDLDEGTLLYVVGMSVTAERELPNQKEVLVSEFWKEELIYSGSKRHTVKDVIGWYANWSGGAHYPPNLPEAAAALKVPHLLREIGEATLAAGVKFLKHAVDLEVHMLVVLPEQGKGAVTAENLILDMAIPGFHMRLSVALLQLTLTPAVIVEGLDGSKHLVKADHMIDWSRPRYISVSLALEDDLSTTIELVVDGKSMAKRRIPSPLFLINNQLYYERYVNRDKTGAPQKLCFGLLGPEILGGEVSLEDRVKILSAFGQARMNPQQKITTIFPQTFGKAPRNSEQYEFVGPTEVELISDLLKRKQPD